MQGNSILNPQAVINQIKPPTKKALPPKNLIIMAFVVAGLGLGTGWLLSGGQIKSNTNPTVSSDEKAAKGANEAGVNDESTFSSTAEGMLEEGGIDGEGTHHLVRPGGAAQTVYLSSTVLDLGSFTGKKVQVWGQTISGRKAGWLMDVGKIKVLE